MANNVIEKALIGVAMVVLTDKEGKKYSFTTATKADTKVIIEDESKIELVIKGVLKAQRKRPATIKGVDVTFQDNMFLPEVIALLQGGTIEYTIDDEFVGYTAPPAGSTTETPPIDIDIYTEHTDTAGLPLGYVKLHLTNGKGAPIEFTMDDGAFFAPTYTITTAPSTGEPPYTMEYVDKLPVID